MVSLGNLLTDYRFHRCDVSVDKEAKGISLSSRSSDAPAKVAIDYEKQPSKANGSPFESLDEAQSFLKYKPTGISVNSNGVDVLRITRDELAWKSRLVSVNQADFAFLNPFDATLEVCYELEPIHYRWNRAERYR